MTAGRPTFRFQLERAGSFEMPVLRRHPASQACAPLIVFAQPLFEEHNRARRLFADLGRALAMQGLTSALPDLPRTGDHADFGPFDMALARESLAAFASAQPGPVCFVSLRGGALLVPADSRHVALAPVIDGDRLLTDLIRAQSVATKEAGGGGLRRSDADAQWAEGRHVHLAGYDVSAATASDLSRPAPGQPGLTLSIGRDADLSGPPVWRQADPEATQHLAEEAASRIAKWLAG